MVHDEFCPSQDIDDKNCGVCMLLQMARSDERDKFDGAEEYDIDSATEEAYHRGYEAGKNAKDKSIVATQQVSPDIVGKYIKDRMTTLSMQEVNALYNLYQFLGGK